LQSRGIEDLIVLNRSPQRAERLGTPSGSLDQFAQLLRADSVVVQTTSVGMWPAVEASPVEWPSQLPAGVVACDLIYNPCPTLFLRQAAALGAACLDGRGMLVHQAARAIRWWSGREDIPTDIMRKVLVDSLAP
jgi:shikimate dehydrogenase